MLDVYQTQVQYKSFDLLPANERIIENKCRRPFLRREFPNPAKEQLLACLLSKYIVDKILIFFGTGLQKSHLDVQVILMGGNTTFVGNLSE